LPRSTTTHRLARQQVAILAEAHLEAFVNLAKACSDHPSDRHLQAVFTRTLVDLDRVLRLRDALGRP
jgi:hypothetical protein